MPRRVATGVIEARYRNDVLRCRMRAEIPKQRDLAHMTGISRTTLSAIERNRIFLSAHHALLIRDALGCTLDDLYTRRRRPGSDSNAVAAGDAHRCA